MIQTTLQKVMSESKRRRETARDMIKHRGDPYVAAENTIESDEQPFRRFYPSRQKEVE